MPLLSLLGVGGLQGCASALLRVPAPSSEVDPLPPLLPPLPIFHGATRAPSLKCKGAHAMPLLANHLALSG